VMWFGVTRVLIRGRTASRTLRCNQVLWLIVLEQELAIVFLARG
jgi:hypothetical protein